MSDICRNSSGELFRIKNGYEECLSNLEEVRRENKSLSFSEDLFA